MWAIDATFVIASSESKLFGCNCWWFILSFRHIFGEANCSFMWHWCNCLYPRTGNFFSVFERSTRCFSREALSLFNPLIIHLGPSSTWKDWCCCVWWIMDRVGSKSGYSRLDFWGEQGVKWCASENCWATKCLRFCLVHCSSSLLPWPERKLVVGTNNLCIFWKYFQFPQHGKGISNLVFVKYVHWSFCFISSHTMWNGKEHKSSLPCSLKISITS